MQLKKVEIAIIGAGTAGLTAYNAARKHTDSVVLIEGGQYGTTCARVGCMPSKLLIAAAESAHETRKAAMFGITVSEVQINGKEVLARVRRERDNFVASVLRSMEKIPAEHKLRGCAKFLAPGRLAIGDSMELEAERIVIATGSSSRIPEMFEDLGNRLLVNDSLFELPDLPASVAVFGSGVIGLELGQALSRLGVHVRLFGRGGALGGIDDQEIRTDAERYFNEEFYLDTWSDVTDVSLVDEGVSVSFVHRDKHAATEVFDYVLVATGRTPNLAGLALENSGLTLNERGMPEIDPATLRCGDQPVFLVGDANAQAPVLHEAAHEGRIAGDNAGRYPKVVAVDRYVPFSIVFSSPQIAAVGAPVGGMTDAERKRYAVGSSSFEDQGRSKVIGKNQGQIKVYGDPASGKLTGAEMLGPAAEHLGHLLAWALQQQMTVRQMLAMPYYHPVIEEGLRSALKQLNANLEHLSRLEDPCLECGPGV